MRMRARPLTFLRLELSLLLASAALSLVGCGGAAPAAKGGVDAPAPPPAEDTGESAQNELDKGEWRITELFGPPGGAAPAVGGATAAPAASASPVTPQHPEAQTKTTTVSTDAEKPADACGIACSALASMERAARHLCELSGPDEPRCQSARERVKNANDRVASHCTCGL